MINALMRSYDYFTLGEKNAYGVEKLSTNPVGKVKLAISLSSQSVQDNINYENAQYVALTHSSLLDNSCVIQYGEEKLKVLYINPYGRYKQVFLARI